MSGAEVTAWRQETGKLRTWYKFRVDWQSKAQTDSKGRFAIGRLAKGTYVLGVTAGPKDEWAYYSPMCYYPGTLSLLDADRLRISPKRPHKDLVIRLVQKGTTRLSVHVTDVETGAPIRKSRVLVNRCHMVWDKFTGFTDERGLFRSKLLTRGPFQITAGAEEQGYARWSKWIEVRPGQEHVEVRFQLPKGARLEGRVVTQDGSELPSLEYFYAALNPERPKEIDGRPLRTSRCGGHWGPKRDMIFLSYEEGPQKEWAQVGEDGRLRWPPVCPGKVHINAELPDKNWRMESILIGGKLLSKVDRPECKPGERIKDVKIIIATNLGVVAGRVVSAKDKRPMENVRVHLWRRDKEIFHAMPAETDRSGSFFFHSIPAGPYAMGIIRSQAAEVEERSKREIIVEPGGVVHLDLVLPSQF